MTNSRLADRAADVRAPASPDAAAALRTTLTRGRKRPEDTAEGCRALAAADLERAAALSGDHSRWRYEHSAAAWTARAGLLDGLETKFRALGERKPT